MDNDKFEALIKRYDRALLFVGVMLGINILITILGAIR